MNESHTAFDQRFEAAESVLAALDLSAARRPHLERTPDQEIARISHDPAVMGGRPCIRGLRITVAMVLNLMASGASRERILEAYPQLEPADIEAALAYAARNALSA
jgi:uncharacterized protein (DUF433 family)